MTSTYTITIDEYTKRKLDRDTRLYHFKSFNQLCNRVIVNYNESYNQSNITYYRIREILKKHLSLAENSVNDIMDDVYKQLYPKEQKISKSGKPFTIRINAETEPLIESLEKSDVDISPSITRYFQGLLESYARLSNIERERILLNSIYRDLLYAIHRHEKLLIDNNVVEPYQIIEPLDDFYGYLVCKFESSNTEHLLSIAKMKQVSRMNTTFTIDPRIQRKLEEGEKKGFRIFSEEATKMFQLLANETTAKVVMKAVNLLTTPPSSTPAEEVDSVLAYVKNADDVVAKDAPFIPIKNTKS